MVFIRMKWLRAGSPLPVEEGLGVRRLDLSSRKIAKRFIRDPVKRTGSRRTGSRLCAALKRRSGREDKNFAAFPASAGEKKDVA